MYDVVIIGGGPAGLTAAIYAARKNLSALVLEGKAVGGAVLTTALVENYPGFESIAGPELAERMERHARRYGAEIRFESAMLAEKIKGGFAVKTSHAAYEAKTLILAMGAEYKKMGIKGEKEFAGRGISYCATCDGPLFRGKAVAVVGGGNTAVSSAIYLATLAEKVYIVHRRGEFRADEALVKQLAGVEKILNAVPVEIAGDKHVRALKVRDVMTKAERTIEVDGVFVCVGETPATEIAKQLGVACDAKTGSIVVDRHRRTNLPGIFAAGDVTGGIRQIVQATADGATAAISAYAFIKGIPLE